MGTALGVPDDLPRDTWVERAGGYQAYYASTNAATPYAPHYAPAVRRGLEQALEREDALLHLNLGFTHLNLVGRRCARRRGVPYVFTPHAVYGRHHLARRSLSKRAFHRVFERRVLADAAAVQALVPAEAEAICDYGAAAERVHVIPNGIDLDEFDRRQPATPLAERLGFDADDGVVLFLARLNASKGLDLLIPAFAAARAGPGRTWRLVVAGPDDGFLDQARALAAEHGVADHVHFPGALRGADKYQALHDADVFALTSYAEGMPVSVLEACAAGTPAVVTDRCNLPAVAEAGAGRVCRPEVGDAAEALRGVMHTDDRGAMARAARRLVSQSYAWPTVLDQLEGLYAAVRGGEGDSDH